MTDASAREIVVSRVFNAGRETLFRAFTEQGGIEQWWGPDGFTTTTYEMDVRPGGVWRFVMHGPDGTDYENLITYREVVSPERLVYDHSDPNDASRFETTVSFEETPEGTRVTLRALFPTVEARNYAVEHYQAIEGGRQTLERLGRHVAALSSS
jgi:uncharacterized protein YndB with AHSA1/START domain